MALPGKIDLNDLVVFGAVMEAGSFSAAAHKLGVAPAKVSVEVARLEARLGAALFARTTRKVTPTESGLALYEEVAPLLRRLLGVAETLPSAGAQLSGMLRIAAPVDHAEQVLAPALAQFAQAHPALQLDLRSSDRVSDLVGEGIDIALRMGWLRDSSLRAVKLATFEQYLVAAPRYLERARAPQAPEDLAGLDWVALDLLPSPLRWNLVSPGGEVQTVQLKSRIKVDSAGSLRAMIRAGAGISVLDQFSAQPEIEAGQLMRLLGTWRLESGGIYAVFPPGRHLAKKVHAFLAFYKDYLQRRGYRP